MTDSLLEQAIALFKEWSGSHCLRPSFRYSNLDNNA